MDIFSSILARHSIISKAKYGFQTGRLTEQALLRIKDKIIKKSLERDIFA